MRKTIEKHRPKIIIEFSPSLYLLNKDEKIGENILLFLKKQNYSIEGIDEYFPATDNPLRLLHTPYEQINILCSPK
jgi:hypothetical protein